MKRIRREIKRQARVKISYTRNNYPHYSNYHSAPEELRKLTYERNFPVKHKHSKKHNADSYKRTVI